MPEQIRNLESINYEGMGNFERIINAIGEKLEYRDRLIEEKRLRRLKTGPLGFNFLVNGNIGGAVGLALAGLLLANSVKWGERWKDYGKKEFYSWKGIRSKGSEIRKAFAGVGKG